MPDRASMDQDYNDNYHQVTGNTKQDIKEHTRCNKKIDVRLERYMKFVKMMC